MFLSNIPRASLGAALISLVSLLGMVPAASYAQAASEPAAATTPTTTEAPASAAALQPQAPVEAVTEKQVIDNPYGLEALWAQGDIVARSVLVIMLIMSMGSWYVIFTKLWEQSKLMRSGGDAVKTFWSAGSIKSGIGTLKEGSAYRYIAESGVKASEHHEGTLVEQIDLHT
jgi:biopolymer transport protein ExbB